MSTDTVLPEIVPPAVPAQIADTAATLRPCGGCGALPGYCLSSLTGMGHRPCCPACDHHPEVPRRLEDMPHAPEVCAAWADERGVPRGVACEAHWLPDAVQEHRAAVVARYWAAVREQAGRARVWSEAELVSARTLDVEERGPSVYDARR